MPEDGVEVQTPTLEHLSKTDSWVHFVPNILLNGRVSHMEPENLPDDVEPEVIKK